MALANLKTALADDYTTAPSMQPEVARLLRNKKEKGPLPPDPPAVPPLYSIERDKDEKPVSPLGTAVMGSTSLSIPTVNDKEQFWRDTILRDAQHRFCSPAARQTEALIADILANKKPVPLSNYPGGHLKTKRERELIVVALCGKSRFLQGLGFWKHADLSILNFLLDYCVWQVPVTAGQVVYCSNSSSAGAASMGRHDARDQWYNSAAAASMEDQNLSFRRRRLVFRF